MKTPRLWRRKRDGVEFGSWHVYIKNKPINLQTSDAQKARERRALAMRGQRRFTKDDSQGAADAVIAALDATPPPSAGVVDGAARTTDAIAAEMRPASDGAPPPLALPPMQAEPEVIDAEPIPQSDHPWTDDVAAGAADTNTQAGSDAGPTLAGGATFRVADLPILQSGFVIVSKMLVQLQVNLQAWTGEKFLKIPFPRLNESEIKPGHSFAEAFAALSAPWAGTDPREMGRQVYEHFLRRICPEELPIPDYVLAPILVALATIPAQVAGAIAAAQERAKQQPAAAGAEAPPDAQAAA